MLPSRSVAVWRVIGVHAVLCAATLAFCDAPADLPGWKLVWQDEFDGASLDLDKWKPMERKDSFNKEKQFYHPDQVKVADGLLHLTAIDSPRADKPFQSGLVTSRERFKHGRFEARIHLPSTQGMWPAFWLNANHVQWPQGGEIDIMEGRGSQPRRVSAAYHWQAQPGPCCKDHHYVFRPYHASQDGKAVNFHEDFHTYAAEWEDEEVRFYVDGNLFFHVTQTDDRPIIEEEKNIILNLAVGGKFDGDPDDTTVFPQAMRIDYVRHWVRDGSE